MWLRPFPNTAGEPAFVLREVCPSALRVWGSTHPDSSASTSADRQAPGAVDDFAGFSKGEPCNHHVTPQSHPLTSSQKNGSGYLHTTFTTAKLWKHNKCPSEDEYTKRGLSIQRNVILSSPRCKGSKAFPPSRASSRQSCLSRGDSSILQKLPSRRPPSPSDLGSGATPWGVGTRRVALLATIRPRSCR